MSFHTKCTINDKVPHLIINGEIIYGMIATSVVKNLGLTTK